MWGIDAIQRFNTVVKKGFLPLVDRRGPVRLVPIPKGYLAAGVSKQ